MALRRGLLMMPRGIDTSPKIIAEGKRWAYGSLVDGDDCYATIIYRYPASSNARQLKYSDLYMQINLFTDDTYVDYWTARNNDTRNVINANANGIAFNLTGNQLRNGLSYAYIPDTGQILFAGKNTPYYGYLNVNDMPSA